MARVNNRRTIFRLSIRTLRANRFRNMVAIIAIALTTLLFTSLFTIAASILEGEQQLNFHQAGGYAQGTFKDLSKAQLDRLKEDALIKAWGERWYLGNVSERNFASQYTEVGYSDANQAKWRYCEPTHGRLPKEHTMEAATNTKVLELLGVKPQIGAAFDVRINAGGQETVQHFVLSGWWPYDPTAPANHLLLPQSRVEALVHAIGDKSSASIDSKFGQWSLDVMLKNGSWHIEEDLNSILANHGFQSSRPNAPNFVNIGVNWGYTGAHLKEKLDMITMAVMGLLLGVIILTGYMIIFNVFQIAIASDIRFYGLLKTIGVTPKQLRSIVRLQAALLSCVGIPLGLVSGWLVGGQLTSVVVARLNVYMEQVSPHPVIFILAAIFSWITVALSCRKPEKFAGRVSPIEAVRYVDGDFYLRHKRRSRKSVTIGTMAVANLERHRKKTVLTILSLSLSVVLLMITVSFVQGIDMDKYSARFAASDFVVANVNKLNISTAKTLFDDEMSIPAAVVQTIREQDGVTDLGVVYGQTKPIFAYEPLNFFQSHAEKLYSQETIESMLQEARRSTDGRIASSVLLYGMDHFTQRYLKVLEGDLSKLSDPEGGYIAAVYQTDDFGKVEKDSNWVHIGDQVTLEYTTHTGDTQTKVYTVAALVDRPRTFSYRAFGDTEFILNDAAFIKDSGTSSMMYVAFNTAKATMADMDTFLERYTKTDYPQLGYESRLRVIGEYEKTKKTFMLLGGVLSSIVALVGLLNFFNAIMTGIIARRRELAVLQAVGMTQQQIKKMLILEGLMYALSAVILSLVISILLGVLFAQVFDKLLWFFTYQLTLWPLAIMTALFALMGIVIPSIVYSYVKRYSVVEKLKLD